MVNTVNTRRERWANNRVDKVRTVTRNVTESNQPEESLLAVTPCRNLVISGMRCACPWRRCANCLRNFAPPVRW